MKGRKVLIAHKSLRYLITLSMSLSPSNVYRGTGVLIIATFLQTGKWVSDRRSRVSRRYTAYEFRALMEYLAALSTPSKVAKIIKCRKVPFMGPV